METEEGEEMNRTDLNYVLAVAIILDAEGFLILIGCPNVLSMYPLSAFGPLIMFSVSFAMSMFIIGHDNGRKQQFKEMGG